MSYPVWKMDESSVTNSNHMGRRLELEGQRFGRLIAIDRASKTCNGHVCWLYRCDCWNVTVITEIHLKSGHTQSCGCIRAECARFFFARSRSSS